MMPKRILYVLHTDWYWIKQRSQFLAEGLCSEASSVDVLYKFSPKRYGKTANEVTYEQLRTVPIPFAPFFLKTISTIRVFDEIIWALFVLVYAKIRNCDAVIFTHPLLFPYVRFCRGKAFYDFHDDNAEFYPEGRLKNLVARANDDAIAGAKGIIFSSCHLRQKFRTGRPSCVIRNAHGLDACHELESRTGIRSIGRIRKFYYFGTISEWFDSELLAAALGCYQNVEFHLIGPVDTRRLIHPRIHYHGAMAHADMLDRCREADAFVMPFRVTPLIEGVDPVKLYEYIAFPVPIICCFYDEIDRFGEFVEFYKDRSEFIELVGKVVSNKFQVDMQRRNEFLKDNTWTARSRTIAKFIDDQLRKHE